MTEEPTAKEKELKGQLITLLARLGSKYEQAQHPALLVTTHVDEILALTDVYYKEKYAGYVNLDYLPETLSNKVNKWLWESEHHPGNIPPAHPGDR